MIWYFVIPFFGLSWSFVGDLWMSLVSTLLFVLVGHSAPSTKESMKTLRKKMNELNSQNSDDETQERGINKMLANFIKMFVITLLLCAVFFVLKLIFRFEFYDLVSIIEECLSRPYIKLTLMFCISLWLGGLVREINIALPKRRLKVS
ncbi:MAG: hypothetical protein SFU25_08005 [Candidatus Caenarcaniphilales bacterium]|nr:hypothetical protein [Candidatus Caenarcaniphilales bacterium]